MRLGLLAILFSLSLAYTTVPTPQVSAASQSNSNLPTNQLGEAMPTPAGQWLGRLAADQNVEFEIGLALPDQAAAEKFVNSLFDQASPNYHKFLSPEEYTARFNPSADQENVVVNYLTQHGFTIVERPANRLFLQVRAPASTVEATFHTQLATYRYQDNTDSNSSFDYFANTYKPILPNELQGLVSGVLLNSFPLRRSGNRPQALTTAKWQPNVSDVLNPHPNKIVANTSSNNNTAQVTSAQTSCATSTGTTPCLTPYGLRQMYNVNPLLNAGTDGTGQTIAVLELGSYTPTAPLNYAKFFGLPSPSITEIPIGELGIVAGTGIEGEFDLDVEVIMALAPKANILAYEGPARGNGFSINAAQIFDKIVTDNRASIVSVSYGQCEGGNQYAFSEEGRSVIHSVLMQGAAQGQNFFVASGDSGIYDCTSGTHVAESGNLLDDLVGVDYPASDPFVISVGGTQFGSGGTAANPKEQVWNSPPASHGYYLDGSGGGISTVFSRPSWQAGLGGVTTSFRTVPDVAALAGAPYYGMFINGASSLVANGGTSAAAPLWAAGALLINQGAGKRVFAVDRLYKVSASGVFHDITVGNNGDSQHAYSARAGYDLATGLGTPNFANLYNALVGQPAVTTVTPTATQTSTNTTVKTTTATTNTTPTVVNTTPQTTATSTAINPTTTPPPPTTPTFNPPPPPPPALTAANPPASTAFNWKKYSVSAVFPLGAAGAWDSSAVYPQTIIWDSNAQVYRMWYIGVKAGALPALGYATSSDAINWTRKSTPVLVAGPGTNWDSKGMLQATVIFDSDENIYKLWYSSSTPYTAPSIGYAISNDGINWNKFASPVLLAGPTSFDFGGIQPATVIKEGGQYRMWYEAVDTQQQRSVAIAFSLDGMHWAKPTGPNVQIANAPYNTEGPGSPQIVHTGNNYYMWFHSTTAIFQASSIDGQNFNLDPGGAILDVSPAGAADSSRLIMPHVVLRTDTNQAYMLYTGYNDTAWQGLLATSSLNLTPITPPIPPVIPPAPPTGPTTTHDFADPIFQQIWQRTDKPVLEGATKRSWIWGPGAQSSAYEEYAEAASGIRLVQYFDKGRMEINNPGGDRNSPYFASSGLLAKELVTGNIQVGNDSYRTMEPSTGPIAGDPDDTYGPSYAAMSKVLTASSVQVGQPEILGIDNQGNSAENPALTGFGVTAAFYVPETRHSIAAPFWNFLNSNGLVYTVNGTGVIAKLFSPTFYVTGLPLTEAYWAHVKVGGQVKDVLIQVFERRILTYTPSNDPTFQVEMGNVGRTYFHWRYGMDLS
jgi:hypothetical protein